MLSQGSTAVGQGLHVAQPIGDNLPYDLLVDSGQEILRAQIKTMTTEVEGKPGKLGFVLQHGGNGSSYQDDTVDFFGLVVLPLRTIYHSPTIIYERPDEGICLS